MFRMRPLKEMVSDEQVVGQSTLGEQQAVKIDFGAVSRVMMLKTMRLGKSTPGLQVSEQSRRRKYSSGEISQVKQTRSLNADIHGTDLWSLLLKVRVFRVVRQLKEKYKGEKRLVPSQLIIVLCEEPKNQGIGDSIEKISSPLIPDCTFQVE